MLPSFYTSPVVELTPPWAFSAADEVFMRMALEEAEAAFQAGEVPVGAVVVGPGEVVLARAGNRREQRKDPTAHAEVLALRQAAAAFGQWRLEGCRLYVTVEPCAMCAAACVQARLGILVFGAPDPKAGFVGSLGNLLEDPRLNHRVAWRGGLLAAEAAGLLRSFFAQKRASR